MYALILKLFLAHIIGDFLFQPDKWVKDKIERTYRSKSLYFHLAIHGLALFLLLPLGYWPGIIVILVTHYIIDLTKLLLEKKLNHILLFIADQVFHLAVIGLVVHYYYPINVDINTLYSNQVLLFISSMITLTYVISVTIKVLLNKWRMSEGSPNNAGKYIGMLERLFIFAFILTNHWEGVGFLIAAKSVFRFGDLTKERDRSLTEYIVIGTLLSFGMAIAVSMAYKYFSGIIS